MADIRSVLAAAGALFCLLSPAWANQPVVAFSPASPATVSPRLGVDVAIEDRLQLLYDCVCGAGGDFDGAIDFGASSFGSPGGGGGFGGMGGTGGGAEAGPGDGGWFTPSLSNSDLQPSNPVGVLPDPNVLPQIPIPAPDASAPLDHAYDQAMDIADDVSDLFGDGPGWIGPTWDMLTCPGILPVTNDRPGNAKAGLYVDGNSAGVCYSGATP